jgi:hypothetical protein
MSRYNGIRPVTNGLVFCVDAANPQSIFSGQTTWSDLSGNRNNGTLTNGPVYISSGTSSGIQFDGVDDYVLINTPIMSPTNNWTYSGWFNMSQIVTGASFYSQYIPSAFNGRIILRLGDDLNAASRFSVFLGSGPTYSNQFLYSNILAGPNINYNYVVVRSGDTYTQYINGVLDTVHTPGVTAQILQTSPRIGNSDTISDFFKGKIFLTQLYNRALSTSEVIQNYDIYNQQRFKIPTPIVTSGMVLNLDTGYYNSYPGTGTTWSDLSGSGNNGTLINGPTYVYSGASSSIQFDGVDDYVSQTYNNLSSGLTFNAWIRTTSTRSVKSYVGDASNNVVGITLNSVWNGFGVTNGKVNYNNARKNDNWGQYNSTASVNDGNWTYITVTHSKTNELVSLYINGTLDSTFDNTSSGVYDQWANMGFNVISRGYGGDYFNGNISVVHIYNRALSATEVSQNFNALRGRFGI